MRRLAFILVAIAAFHLAPLPASADWVHPVVSPRAQLDSLERFLVIRDVEKEKAFGWAVVSLGDITGDGTSDVLICRKENTTLQINAAFLYHGGRPPDGIYEQEYLNLLSNIGSLGDVTADGFIDLQFTDLPEQNFQLLFGGPTFDDTADFEILNRWTPVTPAVDFDGDGALDLAISGSVNGGPVYIYRMDSQRDTIPEYTITDNAGYFGRTLAVCDISGDGWPDLAIGAPDNLDSNFIKFYYGGPGFDTQPDMIIKSTEFGFGSRLLPVGDFNADGYEDIYIGGDQALPYGIYLGGPGFDDKVDIIVNKSFSLSGYFPPTSAARLGDFNSDGYSDFVLGYDFKYEAYLYLGGPTDDTLRLADIYIEEYQMTGSQDFFGIEVAGVGDFNGDGIDDLAVTSRTAFGGSNWYGEVNFFAGYDPAETDVPYEYDPVLPESFTLYQNYPNPFNNATTIEFSLPAHSAVTLEILNILGEHVRTLLDRTLPAGTFRIEWDGTNEQGQPAASGTYLYRLTAATTVLTNKLILLK
jgi:hypothetical protein